MFRLLLFLRNLTACPPPPPAFFKCRLIIPFLSVEPPSAATVCLWEARFDVLIDGPLKSLNYHLLTTVKLRHLIVVARNDQYALVIESTISRIHEQIVLRYHSCLVVVHELWLYGLWGHSIPSWLTECVRLDHIIHIFYEQLIINYLYERRSDRILFQ